MNITSLYIPRQSPVHAADARVKLALLLAYSVALFMVGSWKGMALLAGTFGALLAVSRLPAGRLLRMLAPLYVLLAITLACNAVALDAGAAQVPGVSDSLLAGAPFLAVGQAWGVSPVGFERGCFISVRIILLVLASLLVSFSTTSTQLMNAFLSALRPLRPLRVPVDDIATTLSLALRFIPTMAVQLGRVRDAQWARGASLASGSLPRRLRAWAAVMIPLFVSLFRRADAVATAMDARCYGNRDVARTSLSGSPLAAGSIAALVAGLALCAGAALLR